MIRIITDSGSDISQSEASKLGITVIPLKVRFNDIEYIDDVTITNEEFFNRLVESDELPKTSQLTPFDYTNVFDMIDKNDKAIVICLSGNLSGTYNSAFVASIDYDNIYVIDSKNVTIGQRLLVLRALELTKKYNNIDEILNILETEKKKIRLVALLDTLEYLKKGGRISATTALVGELLNIKPVLAVEDGKIVLIGKARGSKNGNNKLREVIEKYHGIDYKKPYAVAYSGLDDSLLQKYIADSKDLCDKDIPKVLIGSVIGTHIGPGAIAVAFFCHGDDLNAK